MATYKVTVTADGDKTSYTINGHELATVTKTADSYAMTTNGKTLAFATSAEADAAAKAAVTQILASVGCFPNFINE